MMQEIQEFPRTSLASPPKSRDLGAEDRFVFFLVQTKKFYQTTPSHAMQATVFAEFRVCTFGRNTELALRIRSDALEDAQDSAATLFGDNVV